MYGMIKFIHFVALMLGATAGFGNLAVALHVKRAGDKPVEALTAMRPFFSKLGLGAIGLLWVTGVILFQMRWTDAGLGVAFYLKLLVAALIYAAVVMLGRMGRRAAETGTPPPAIMPALSKAASLMTLLAVALAVYVFG